MPPPALAAALFVSCVRDKPVTRLPIIPGARGGAVLIGATRGPDRSIVYDEEAVIALMPPEVKMHGRIYRRAIDEGDLRERTFEDFTAYQAAIRKRKAEVEKVAPVGVESNGPAAPAGGE